MRCLSLILIPLCLLGVTACASAPEEKPDAEMDFFERLAKVQEGREAARRDAELARRKGKSPKGKKSEGDGTLEYYARSKDRRNRRSEPILVTWEGLARERELAANSKYARESVAPMKITLMSEGHPEATSIREGRTKEDRAASAHTAVLRDGDLQELIRGLDKRGFFDHARATDLQESSFRHPRARGRVTIERNGQSVTLLSMRGQGQDPRTKAIPGLYSESKKAIMLLRNRTPGLNLSSVETDSILPGFGR